MMWHAHEGMGWWMLFAGMWSIVFWALLVGLVVWAARGLTGRGEARSGGPLDIARERYARGEITRAEYDQLRRDLMDGPTASADRDGERSGPVPSGGAGPASP